MRELTAFILDVILFRQDITGSNGLKGVLCKVIVDENGLKIHRRNA